MQNIITSNRNYNNFIKNNFYCYSLFYFIFLLKQIKMFNITVTLNLYVLQYAPLPVKKAQLVKKQLDKYQTPIIILTTVKILQA